MGEKVQISFRIPAELAEALARVAAAEDRTMSAEIRRLVRQRVAGDRLGAAASRMLEPWVQNDSDPH